jgi:hypothetical protein
VQAWIDTMQSVGLIFLAGGIVFNSITLTMLNKRLKSIEEELRD